MSTVDLDIFGPPPSDEEDELHPEFSKVLLGFDPRHVEEFVAQIEERIMVLERQLRDARSQVDAANRRAGAAREEAYAEVAGKMAELVRAADLQAEKLRRDTEETCHRQMAESQQQAEQIRREAEAEGEAMRTEADTGLARARTEANRILGELGRQRDALIDDLQRMRAHLLGLADDIQATTALARATTIMDVDPTEPPIAPGVDDLLGSLEGFELAGPAPFSPEDEQPPAQQA